MERSKFETRINTVRTSDLRKLGLVFGGCSRCGNDGWLYYGVTECGGICLECMHLTDDNLDAINKKINEIQEGVR